MKDSMKLSLLRLAARERFHGLYNQALNECTRKRVKMITRRLLIACLALAAGVSLAGCFWLVAGGAGVAGYKVGTDERSVGTQIDDGTITSKINAKLIAEPGIRSLNIDVDTLDGNVTLSGYAKSEQQIQRIIAISRSVSGVKSVISNLKLKGQ